MVTIMDHGHAKDSDRGAKVLDVEGSGEGAFELPCPFGVTAEDEEVINVDRDEHNQRGSDQRVTRAVTFQLV